MARSADWPLDPRSSRCTERAEGRGSLPDTAIALAPRSGKLTPMRMASRGLQSLALPPRRTRVEAGMARRYLDQRLKLQMLRVVATIETSGSILKAAAALGVSQPALTKTLQELEDIVQLRLFDRHSRGVRVTDAGRQLVRTARTILAEIARLDEQLDLLSTPGGGSVAVGALPVAAAGLLPGVLARLKAQHPRTQVRLQQGRTEDLLPLLAAGDLDMIVGRLYAPLVPDGFLREPLWSEPISLLARSDHPIFGAGEVTVAEIERYGLVLPTVTQRVGQEIEHALSLLGLTSAQSLRSNSYGFIREMMHDTDILSIMPRLLMVGDLLRGALRVVPLPVSTPERPAGLILHRDREILPAGAAFVEVLRRYVDEISRQGLLPPSSLERAHAVA
jgi:LysR family transcriptional regulator, pca operon transcriptional activator